MDDAYLAKLPSEVQRMVEEVESAIGREIVVRQRTDGDPSLPGLDQLATLMTEFSSGHMSFTVLLNGAIQPHTLAHEVAHAWLKSCRKTLSISADELDQRAFSLANLVSNDIEHLVVIPFEVNLSTDARRYWQSLYGHCVEELGVETNSNKVRGDGFRHLAVIDLALRDAQLAERVRQILHRNNCLDEAERFVHELSRENGDVSQAMVIAARYLVGNPTRYHYIQYSPDGCTRIPLQ